MAAKGGGGFKKRRGGCICSQLQPSAFDNLPADQQTCLPAGQQPSTAATATSVTENINASKVEVV